MLYSMKKLLSITAGTHDAMITPLNLPGVKLIFWENQSHIPVFTCKNNSAATATAQMMQLFEIHVVAVVLLLITLILYSAAVEGRPKIELKLLSFGNKNNTKRPVSSIK